MCFTKIVRYDISTVYSDIYAFLKTILNEHLEEYNNIIYEKKLMVNSNIEHFDKIEAKEIKPTKIH